MSNSISAMTLKVLFILVLVRAVLVDGAIRYEEPFYELSDQVVTPHIPWAKPLAGGKVSVLVIGPRIAMREVLELAQRLEVEHHEVMSWSSGTLGSQRNMRMYNQAEGAMVADVEGQLREKLARPHDVIVVGNLQWNILPQDVRQDILEQTRQGGGLIYAHPPKNWVQKAGIEDVEIIAPVSPFIYRGVPFAALTAFASLRGSEDPVSEFVALYQLGQGRLAVLEYPQTTSQVVCMTAAPTARGDHSELEYEYLQSFLIKTILWAADRVPGVLIGSMVVEPEPIQVQGPDKARLHLELENHLENLPAEIQWTLRDDMGPPLGTGSLDTSLKKGRNSFSFFLPRLAVGTHLADVSIISQGAKLNWGSLLFKVESVFGIDSVATSKAFFEAGESITGEVALRAMLPADAVLKVRLVDHLGRILAQQAGPPAQNRVFSFQLDDPRSSLYRVEADLFVAGELIENKAVEFPVRRVNDNDFTLWMWPARGSAYDQISKIVLKQMAAMGVDGFSNLYPYSEEWLRSFARHNFFQIPYMSSYRYGGGDPDTSAVRKPCLTDPLYREREAVHLKQQARLFAPYGPPLYTLGDENELGPDYKDICFSTTCKADFRIYLKDIYSDLDALNEEWGTAFANWDEVAPIRLEEAQSLGQIPRWADHRLHMEKVFLDMHLFASAVIRQIDAQARVGFDGAWYTSSWVGYDFWDLMNNLELMVVYYPPEQLEQMRSFKRPGTATGSWYGGYVWGGFGAFGHFKYAPQRREDFQRYWPWHLLLHGCNGAWWFHALGLNESAIAPDMSIYPIFQHTMEEVKEIKSGVARLLLNAERLDNGIALHYSQTNTHASTLEHALTSTAASQRSFIKLLEDLGFQYRYLASQQIAAGELIKGGYRLLVLPYVQSLSAAEAVAIEDFVEAGGVLLADLRPGVFDEHLKGLPRGRLDQVFGIERRRVEWTQRVRAELKEDGLSRILPGSKVDSQVRLKGGESLQERGGVPLFITRQIGRGRTLLLNFALDPYLELRKEKREVAFNHFFRSLLADLGIRPPVQVHDDAGVPLRAQEVVTFKDGELEYVAVKRDAEVVEVESERANVIFPRRAHLYNLRNGDYLGYGRRARVVLARMTPQVFSLLPYHVGEIEIELDKPVYRPGDRVEVQVNLQTSTGPSGNHVIRMEVKTPVGDWSRVLSRTLSAAEGKAVGFLDLALNDPEGNWNIRVRDVATGGTAIATFTLAGAGIEEGPGP